MCCYTFPIHILKGRIMTMTLFDATRHYSIYLQTLHLSKPKKEAYLRGLLDIQQFYGGNTNLESFDENELLDYVRVNDPFDCDPLHTERGAIFCNFVHWLMRNHLVPAWRNQMADWEEDLAFNKPERRSPMIRSETYYIL